VGNYNETDMYFENLVKQYLEENAELLELIVKYGTM
jgi:hypothetical protein